MVKIFRQTSMGLVVYGRKVDQKRNNDGWTASY